MAKVNTKSKKGFTIIEVVLVLAIAGLIFLMVFIALPALQRSQRDTQRRNDLSRVITAIQNYQTNNRGKLPDFTKTNFTDKYLRTSDDTFSDPSGDDYTFYKKADGTSAGVADCGVTSGDCKVQAPSTFKSGVIVAVKNATCSGEKAVYASGSTKVAVLMKLEGAGVACVNN